MTVLSMTDVGFSYQQKAILKGVSFSLSKGKLVGIVGPNGGGKSTLLKMMAKHLVPQQGVITLNGQALSDYSMKALAKTLAFLPQQPISPAGITVEQLVQYGRHPHQGWFNQWSDEDAVQVSHAIDKMKLNGLLTQPMTSLSGGATSTRLASNDFSARHRGYSA